MDFAALPTFAGLSSDARQWTPEQWLAHMHQERAAPIAPTQSELRGLYRRAVLMLPADGQSEAFAQLLVEYARLLSDGGLNEEAEEQFRFARTLSKKFAFTHIASAQFELDRGNRDASRAHLLTGMSAGAEPRHALVNALSSIDRGDTNLVTLALPSRGDCPLDGACRSNISGHHGTVAHCSDQPSSSLYGSDSQEQLHVFRDLTNSSGSSTRRAVSQSRRAPLRDLPVVPQPTLAASVSTDVESSDGHHLLPYERAVRQASADQPCVVRRFASSGPPTAAITSAAAAAPPTTTTAASTASSLPYTLGVVTSADVPTAQRASRCAAKKQEEQLNRPMHCSPTREGSSVTPSTCGTVRRASAAPEVPSGAPASAAQASGGRSLRSGLPGAATSSSALRKDGAFVGVATAAAAALAANGSRDGLPITEAAAATALSSMRAPARRPSDVPAAAADALLQPIAFNLQPQSNYPVLSSSLLKSGTGAASASLPSSRGDAVAESPNLMASSSPDTALSVDNASGSTLDPSHSFGWSQSGSIGIAVDPLCRIKPASELAASESRASRRGVYAPPPQPSLQQQHRRCSVADHGAPVPADGCSDAGTRHLSRSGGLMAASAATAAAGSPHDEFNAGSRVSRHDQLAPTLGSTRRSLSAGHVPSASSAAGAQTAATSGGVEVKLRPSGIYAAAASAHARHVGAACDDRSPLATTSALPNSCFLPMRVPAGTAQRADLESDEDDSDAPRGYAAPSVGSSSNSSVTQAISRRVRTTSAQTESQPAGSMGVCELVVVKDKEYYVLSVLGRGGSSQVRRVFDPRERTVLALKTVNLSCIGGSISDRERALEFFAREIRILERLQTYSNQVVKMIDFDHDQSANELHILLECGDVDLANLLKNRLQSDRQQQLLLPLQPGAVVLPDQASGAFIRSLWVDMLHAVAVLHKEGIIHCDLKPANFVLVAGRVKLIDFGIANELEDDMSSIALEHAAGTLNFMAPEVLCPVYPSASSVAGGGRNHDGTDASASAAAGHDKKTKIGVRADIWSLGCILYYAVYGRTPFQLITNSSHKIAAIVNPDYDIDYPPVADSHLLDTMKMCLVRNPRQRATIEQLLQHPYVTGASSVLPNSGGMPRQ